MRRMAFLCIALLSYMASYGQGIPVSRDTSQSKAKAIKPVLAPAGKEVIYQGAPVQNKFEISQEDGKIVVSPETMPSFPGGQPALEEFIAANMRYPEEALKAGAEGIVVVKFTIEYDGTAHSPVILLDKVGHGANAETKRLVQLMPKWIPATLSQQPVTVEFTMPVNYNLKKYHRVKGNK
ncbi:MAG: energy transducer TonB [Saprospiraceae bacterium]|nr:MAG: TonB family protein [Candidatus Parvibacillus calidus]MBX2936574.1 energy transducer TonB [Saprospiraceae bacterium]MBK7739388.1 energy transducer TonB [Candidatus Parvibacillus calidus]MBX7179372.1 energy transducer TonB [Saprospiraceae bacterium]MCB0591000.1 energy transducer TonB [Saprospiraceae bacterium]